MKSTDEVRGKKKKNRKKQTKINETKSWFFQNINKIDNPLAGLKTKRIEKTQIAKSRNKKGPLLMTSQKNCKGVLFMSINQITQMR